MTYYGGKELAAAFRRVRNNTLTIANDIPENQYHFKASPETRSIAQTLVHIAYGTAFQMHIQSNKIADLKLVNFPELMRNVMAEEAKPRTKAEIIALLTKERDHVGSFLESLSEAFLAEPVTMPPGAETPTKSRFEMLLGMKEHEMHHRAQLMTMERMIGVVPHLTRQMQERMAAMQAAGHSNPAAAGAAR